MAGNNLPKYIAFLGVALASMGALIGAKAPPTGNNPRKYEDVIFDETLNAVIKSV